MIFVSDFRTKIYLLRFDFHIHGLLWPIDCLKPLDGIFNTRDKCLDTLRLLPKRQKQTPLNTDKVKSIVETNILSIRLLLLFMAETYCLN